MAQDVVDRLESLIGDTPRRCITRNLKIHGYSESNDPTDPLSYYGSDELGIRELVLSDSTLAEPLSKNYPYIAAQVVWAVEREMAQHVEDVLARRIRMLFLDARESIEMAPRVAEIMARELHKGKSWIETEINSYKALASNYIIN
jgi:glycerol-3-phosphate dehydrogenase